MDYADPLDLFLPPVREWFRNTLGEPTAAQRLGWPAIASGQNTLILAPTGSGKTLAAFLACLDGLWRQDPLPRGVRVLYVSPLKALNNDIHRNLQVPLEGVAETTKAMGTPLPPIEAGVRTGDTPTVERQRQMRRPPHVLITTPESLHLLLTSRGRESLRGVTHCIVDEIHALCASKRGVFLALLLERLRALTGRDFVRVGLSATQRPVDGGAGVLGGCGRWWGRRRWRWASTWGRSTWSARSSRRAMWRGASSGWGGPGTWSARRARGGWWPSRPPTCWSRRCWPARWPPAASRRCGCRPTASTCWRSRWWRWWPSSRGRCRRCMPWSVAPTPTATCRRGPSRASWR